LDDLVMEYRRFGKTEWMVSVLSLGTVELGLDYGFYRPGEPKVPSRQEACRLLVDAFEAGVNLVDTAPSYGNSEEIVGEALRQWRSEVFVATKVDCEPGIRAKAIRQSIEQSLRRLGRERLSLVQLHNATRESLTRGAVLETLARAREAGKIEHLGASVYGVEAALAALRHPELAMVQAAYNLLDQRMRPEVFEEAIRLDKGVLVRSALLKGVLTDRFRLLPDHLKTLKSAARRARSWAGELELDLSQAALRFCASTAGAASVLVGVRNQAELHSALQAVSAPLGELAAAVAETLAVEEEGVLDPRRWSAPAA
jgi:aryl-alcohol dehydrogenase-like predicted oxidoreductase